MHATDFLKAPHRVTVPAVVVLHGEEWQLMHAAEQALIAQVLGDDPGDELSVTRCPGKEADLRSVRDELRTVSMFGDRRIVVLESADEFVTKYRPELEDYVDRPSSTGILLLECLHWRKNTRLAKRINEAGLELECTELTGARLLKWLTDQSERQHGRTLNRDAAELLVTLAGSSLALLDQELAKLAAYVGGRTSITRDDVQALVGGWKAETTWIMTSAIRDGQVSVAIGALERLLRAGEAPQKLLGGVTFVFGRLAQGTERARAGVPLPVALKDSGVFPRDIDASVAYLRRIGRPKAETLLGRLVRADSDLKGGSRLPEAVQLELLILDLCGATERPALSRPRPR
jgi:DNA polymerase-3 subunit delta